METKMIVIALLGCVATAYSHGVATSHQSVVSGEGWRYGYDIAHGPHGIGHAVGESYPHGYGGFGTYAPSFGYNTKPHLVLPPPPPKPLVIQVPQYILPHHHTHLPYGLAYPYGYTGSYGGYLGYGGLDEYGGYLGHHHHHY